MYYLYLFHSFKVKVIFSSEANTTEIMILLTSSADLAI